MKLNTLEIGGTRYVVIPETEYQALKDAGGGPALPGPNASGNFPARQTMQAMMARRLIADRRAAGLTQAKLAELAGVRVETINRIEKGRNMPDVATTDKIGAAIRKAGRKSKA